MHIIYIHLCITIYTIMLFFISGLSTCQGNTTIQQAEKSKQYQGMKVSFSIPLSEMTSKPPYPYIKIEKKKQERRVTKRRKGGLFFFVMFFIHVHHMNDLPTDRSMFLFSQFLQLSDFAFRETYSCSFYHPYRLRHILYLFLNITK